MDSLYLFPPDDNTPQKTCKGCGHTFPATTEFFYPHSQCKYGVRSRCKECTSQEQKKRNENHIEPAEKKCTGPCGRILPATVEYFHRNGSNSLYTECKECRSKKRRADYRIPEKRERILAKRKIYRDHNKEKIYAAHAAWRNRPEGREYRRNYTRSYRMRPGVLERKYEWDKAYNHRPETREHRRPLERAWSSIRRARKRNLSGTYTANQIQDMLKRQKSKCYYCHAKFEKNNGKDVYHIDHVIPLSRGGSNDISNIVCACPNCNRRKHDKLPHEWLDGGRLC